MITLSVISYNGTPALQPRSATFDEQGGTIGRGETNRLVLPDPQQALSRIHAQVVWRSGRFAIVDRGQNPMVELNGQVLENGVEVPLGAGDRLQIGGYVLRVDAAPAEALSDPFASAGATRGAVYPDPFAVPTVPAAPVPASPFAAASRRPAPAIPPEDWDPFAPPAVPPPPGAAPADPFDDFGLTTHEKAQPLVHDLNRLRRHEEDSIDSMFDLATVPGADPFGDTPLAPPLAQPNTGSDNDPLRALGRLPTAPPAAVEDRGSDLNAAFELPRVVPPHAPPSAPFEGGAGGKSVLSWGDAAAARDLTIVRPVARVARAAMPIAAPLPAASWPTEPVTMIMPPSSAARVGPTAPTVPIASVAPAVAPTRPPVRAPSAEAADPDALLAALRDGLRMPQWEAHSLTPDLMRLIGEMLREAAGGTVALLIARAELKRGIRAEMTMIAASENNPLKFSKTADVALDHLLNPPVRGFMTGAAAMRDAYDDLRAHEIGVMAGMRAALEGVLKRFDPVVLERRLGQKSVLANLLPAMRKARLWELFNDLYAQISDEAGDDYHELFGKAFLKAYEEYVAQLQQEAPP